MSMYTADTIHIHIDLDKHGDAHISGSLDENYTASGAFYKHRLFAWHEASFYGTDLIVENIRGVETIILPADQVIPFFTDLQLLQHVEWVWSGQAERLLKLAPLLTACIEQKKYVPSYSAYQAGHLQWTWDEDALESHEQIILARTAENASTGLIDGLQAAFSATVMHRDYGTELAAADLRREFPVLFQREGGAVAGFGVKEWLVAVGWKADTAPFRPMLQLLEPGDAEPNWHLQLVLQDKLDAAAIAHVRLAADGTALGVWPSEWSMHVQERSASWLERIRASLPASLFANADNKDIFDSALDDEAAWRFLTADSQRLIDAGWQVLLPAWWEAASRKKPRLRARVSSSTGSRTDRALFGLDSLIDYDWRIAIGETDLSEAEFAELMARNERLVRFRGQWIELDPALLAQIRQAMARVDKGQGVSFQDVLQLHLLGGTNASDDESADGGAAELQPDDSDRVKLEVELNEHLVKLIGQLGQQAEWPKLAVPAGLHAELRPYQQSGYAWLAFLRRFGLGACLADDMGLGKTVQFIAYLLHIQENTAEDSKVPSLLICPTSVLGNWQKELTRFAPSLNVMLHYGSRRLSGEAFTEAAKQADLVLTSYAISALDQETVQSITWTSLCLDEAQNIKNAQAKQSSAVRSIPARHRIALTGTPIENRLSELWSIYDYINPGYLGNARAFNSRFSNAIEKEHDEQRTSDLQKLVKPFMLRRKKKDPAIQLDLPDKNEMKTYINLTAEQGALYEQTVNHLMERMQKLEGIERKGAILATLTQLKQLCDHPMLMTKEPLPNSSRTASDNEIDIDIEGLINRSSKLERLLAMVKELREEGDRCLIFTQYIGMGQLLKLVLEQELQEPVLYLNGSTSKSGRDRMIEQFQFQAQSPPAHEQPSVFILSLKAGGVGLNLTAANHVFHFDRWWNPAVENQATDRAYRMGQTRDVQVHKFIALGTLEERIDEMLDNKQQLSENVISASEGWITELSTDELKDLFTLRREF
ncbi:MAG: DEAD/DEAH box helicase [Paenibacillaceae bacterium]